MLTQAWDDAYHELWSHAAHHRGLRESIGELPGHMLSRSLQQWPRTCGGDVVAIAAVLDPVLRAAPLEAGGHGVERKWRRCAADLEDTALAEPAREYRHNRTFWSALASISAYLASVGAPVPASMWEALLAEVASPGHAARDAILADDQLHLTAYSYDELWQAQQRELARLRGADLHDPAPRVIGSRMSIPRTTNADALQLAAFWTDVLAQVEHQRHAMGPEGPHALHANGLDGEIRRWRAVLEDVDTHATTGPPSATYPRNEALWRGTASVSVTVSVLDETPPPFGMRLDPLFQRPSTEHRNATYPGEGTFETRWDKQHDDFLAARGFDLRDPLPARVGRPMKIPRTLNAEIVQLAGDWNAAWKKLEDRRGVSGNLPTEIGLDTLQKRWTAVVKDVREIAEPGKVDEVYPKNHEFWRESLELAKTLDLFNEIPSKLDIAIDIAKTLPDRLADVVGQIALTVGDIAHKAGEGVISGLGKPIVIGGSVVLGGILLWRLTRRRRGAEAA